MEWDGDGELSSRRLSSKMVEHGVLATVARPIRNAVQTGDLGGRHAFPEQVVPAKILVISQLHFRDEPNPGDNDTSYLKSRQKFRWCLL